MRCEKQKMDLKQQTGFENVSNQNKVRDEDIIKA